jgi:hypothetical protein
MISYTPNDYMTIIALQKSTKDDNLLLIFKSYMRFYIDGFTDNIKKLESWWLNTLKLQINAKTVYFQSLPHAFHP